MAYTSREEIIWRPIALYQPTSEFGILLSREFTHEMLELKIGSKIQREFNTYAEDEVMKKFKYTTGGPYEFDEDSAFIRQFNLGSKGKWLALTGCFGENPLEANRGLIKYDSHNLETMTDAYALMALFDLWVEYSKVLKE